MMDQNNAEWREKVGLIPTIRSDSRVTSKGGMSSMEELARKASQVGQQGHLDHVDENSFASGGGVGMFGLQGLGRNPWLEGPHGDALLHSLQPEFIPPSAQYDCPPWKSEGMETPRSRGERFSAQFRGRASPDVMSPTERLLSRERSVSMDAASDSNSMGTPYFGNPRSHRSSISSHGYGSMSPSVTETPSTSRRSSSFFMSEHSSPSRRQSSSAPQPPQVSDAEVDEMVKFLSSFLLMNRFRRPIEHPAFRFSLGFINDALNLGLGDPIQIYFGPSNDGVGEDEALRRLEIEAKQRRSSTNGAVPKLQWQGTLAPSNHENPTYANKVFIGGLPYNATEDSLYDKFEEDGVVSVQFPPRGRGHAYLSFERAERVKDFLDRCEVNENGQFFRYVPSRNGKGGRRTQIIPWALEDSEWPVKEVSVDDDEHSEDICGSANEDSRTAGKPSTTVFVGALHGEITARCLREIFTDLFGPVVHVGIDFDKTRYPNGSARVTFESTDSFRAAVLAEFIQIITPRFTKIIQIDAYVEEEGLKCFVKGCFRPTAVFCRHPSCFCYFCPLCFEKHRRGTPAMFSNLIGGYALQNTPSPSYQPHAGAYGFSQGYQRSPFSDDFGMTSGLRLRHFEDRSTFANGYRLSPKRKFTLQEPFDEDYHAPVMRNRSTGTSSSTSANNTGVNLPSVRAPAHAAGSYGLSTLEQDYELLKQSVSRSGLQHMYGKDRSSTL